MTKTEMIKTNTIVAIKSILVEEKVESGELNMLTYVGEIGRWGEISATPYGICVSEDIDPDMFADYEELTVDELTTIFTRL